MLIREINKDEYNLLKEFTYEAVFAEDENDLPCRTVLDEPRVKVYYDNFGKDDDCALVAIVDDKIVGIAWARILAEENGGYGNIDKDTPELAMSLLKEYRNKGIGTKLLEELIYLLKEKGYCKFSLSVDKNNYAAKLYKKIGFEIVEENEEDYIMIYKF